MASFPRAPPHFVERTSTISIEHVDKESCEKAISYNGMTVDGKALTITKDVPQSKGKGKKGKKDNKNGKGNAFTSFPLQSNSAEKL